MRKYKTIEVRDYEEMLKEINISEFIDLNNHDLLIYGGGGQDRKFYSDLKTNPKCEVLWTGWSGPKWSAIFSFVPGQAGLVKILEQSAFKDIYYELAAHSVSDVIYVPKDLTESVQVEASERTWRARFESFTEKAPNSFLLTSEADETVIEDGKEMYFYDYYFGSEIIQGLRNIIERKNQNKLTTKAKK
ncbi:hypothetical protein QQ020_28350 [Fulvivirgaceae bacterium BMA12]|uniref:Uncharacterized protein n=1 Tax=Agaribacillus aureus TaxID=3051825 RepID=A0ABT8LEL4_9BACT|nr:hypothetical protein [Fulvivirgaceae bacterium BMA12]